MKEIRMDYEIYEKEIRVAKLEGARFEIFKLINIMRCAPNFKIFMDKDFSKEAGIDSCLDPSIYYQDLQNELKKLMGVTDGNA